MKNRIKAPVLALTAAFALSGCGLLDVDNPNNLVEESIEREAAANGVANGSLRLVSNAYSFIIQAPGLVSDELYWTGSRDAWFQLDQGFIEDPQNEFTDAAFPQLGRGVWMAQNAVDILTEHVANNPGDDDFAKDLHRAQMFNGFVLTITGELQEDMTFSNKMEDGPAVGPGNMSQVLDRAITNLDAAVTGFNALGETDLAITARALRARAHMSRAIWDRLNPSATVGGAIAFTAAMGDADAVIAANGGSDWMYNLAYTSGSGSSDIHGWINNRGENQWDPTLIYNSGPGASGRDSVALMDPVTGEPSVAVTKAHDQFGDDQYGVLTATSVRLMHLIRAENALAATPPNTATFVAEINAIRALDDETAYVSGGAAADLAMLRFTRRVNTLIMGLRLQDMYRWGLSDPLWVSGSAAVLRPGEMLPITIIECRANQYLDSNTCAPTG